MSDDRLIPRLLAGRDELSRVEKDAIFARVVAPAPRRMKWWWLGAPIVATGIVLVALAPWRSTARTDEFAARGGSQAIAALHVACAGEQASGCAAGAKLVFDVHGTSAYRYFAAFAKRRDGTVLWYFPTADDATSVELATARGGVLDRGIVLGPEHTPGTYRVYGVFSAAPLTRASIRAAFDADQLTAGTGTSVVVADVEVK